MANGVDAALRGAAEKLGTYLDGLSKMQVETYGTELDGNGKLTDQRLLMAQTTLSIDGDTTVLVPMKLVDNQVVVDTDLLALHEKHVKTAMDYRASVIAALISALRG